jgi:hypothetical protein
MLYRPFITQQVDAVSGGDPVSIAQTRSPLPSSGGYTGSTQTITYSSTPSEGQLMIWWSLTIGVDSASIAPPAGWTTATLPAVDSNGHHVGVFYKLAGASESNSYLFDLTGDGTFGTRFCGTVLDNVNQTTPVIAVGGRKFSSVTSVVMSTVSQSDTTAVNFSPNTGDMLLAFWASGTGNRTTAGNPTFSNSFGNKHEWDSTGGNQLWVRAHRVYESNETGQNCTASWSGSSAGTSTIIMHIGAE